MPRTTINLDDDVAAAVDRLRREQDLGISEAVNELARRGLVARDDPDPPFVQKTYPLGLKVDITNVAEVLDALDRADAG